MGFSSKGGCTVRSRQVVDEYLSFLQIEKGLSSNSVQAYATDLRQFMGFLQENDLAWTEVETEDVEEFLHKLAVRSISPRTRARKISALRSFFDYLVDEQLLQHNPCAYISS